MDGCVVAFSIYIIIKTESMLIQIQLMANFAISFKNKIKNTNGPLVQPVIQNFDQVDYPSKFQIIRSNTN